MRVRTEFCKGNTRRFTLASENDDLHQELEFDQPELVSTSIALKVTTVAEEFAHSGIRHHASCID